jgi:hypothetical protein
MASSRHEERLIKAKEEESRLEAELFGNAEQDKIVLDDEEVINPEKPTEIKIELTDDILNDVTVPEDTLEKPTDDIASLRKELSDSQHRYNRYKGSTDRTLFKLRAEAKDLNETITRLRSEIADLNSRVTIPNQEDVFTQEVIDVLGEEAVDAIKRSTSLAHEQLAEIRKQMRDAETSKSELRARELHADNVRDFETNLERLVPDLHVMNKDAGFNDWLRQPGSDGVERLTVLREDQARFDYNRVSEFFIKYKAAKKTGKTAVKDNINQHIGPTNSNTTDANHAKDQRVQGSVKQSEINEFNRRVDKGEFKYFPEKAEAFEAKVFKAMNEGKIIFDERPK